MERLKKGWAWVGAIVLCPCHLPLLAALLAGTGAGAFLAQNFAVIFAVFGVGFVLALLQLSRQLSGTSGRCESSERSESK